MTGAEKARKVAGEVSELAELKKRGAPSISQLQREMGGSRQPRYLR